MWQLQGVTILDNRLRNSSKEIETGGRAGGEMEVDKGRAGVGGVRGRGGGFPNVAPIVPKRLTTMQLPKQYPLELSIFQFKK